jgi:hypothetical protein
MNVQEIQYDKMAYQIDEEDDEAEDKLKDTTEVEEISTEVAALSLNHLN